MRFGESVVNGGNVQPYRHTGMEMQSMHGLNWIDNKTRMRSVNVPEFTTMDPLAEMYYGISPYGYCADNPIYYVDPDGLWEAIAGGYETTDNADIEQFLSYYQSEQAITQKDPNINQMLSFIGTVKNGGEAKLSDGSYLLSGLSMTKSESKNNWIADIQNLNNVGNEIADIRSGHNGSRGFFNGLDNFAGVGGLSSDILKTTGTLGSIGIWKDLSKVKNYPTEWTGNGTVRTFGVASSLGYGMYGLSLIANLGLYFTKQQSGLTTGINIGINTFMLRMPLQVSVPYGVGAAIFQIQQRAFKTLIQNGNGDNPGLFNEDFLH